MKDFGILYIVATPIGNLQDISFRAVSILRNADLIACEDTRKTGILLASFRRTDYKPTDETTKIHDEKHPRLISYYEHNELQRIPQIIQYLKTGLSVALVSDAGTPTISDPGFKLVRECIKENIKVEAIPGPSSVISSLATSGLPTDKFLFVGYPPKKEGHRKTFFNKLLSLEEVMSTTIIIFEAPHRLLKTLKEMEEVFGSIDVVIARELTKIHEEIRREKISNSIEHYTRTKPKGEIVILFNLKLQ
ncbi:16S rRNA (cytidine(1402)-2'-O)-methyltransferase [Patescibacteria group bacterium]|nr:16S rRNA (cytidine(1402)-2'-O)-methyltransferase [Patescibacteria group bacterium]